MTIIFLFFLVFKVSLQWADVIVALWVANRNTVTMWLKVSIFINSLIRPQHLILKGDVLAALMIGCIHVLAVNKAAGVYFELDWGSFILFPYLDTALLRRVAQGSTFACF